MLLEGICSVKSCMHAFCNKQLGIECIWNRHTLLNFYADPQKNEMAPSDEWTLFFVLLFLHIQIVHSLVYNTEMCNSNKMCV